MRELRVVGLERDSGMVVVSDEQSGEKFRIPADDRLRAAARGDITRLGQIEIEMESSLRPREIQSRIRAGATVAQVAAAAGVSPEKVERFAHPVLLERARAAELAGAAHPIAIDGPTSATLAEVVASSLGSADHGDDSVWDAWKGEDGYWIVQVGWRIGRTEHYAHWRYLPGSYAGTVEPLDEAADELTDPEYSRPLRNFTSTDFGSNDDAPPSGRHAWDGAESVTLEADAVTHEQRDRATATAVTTELPPVLDEPHTFDTVAPTASVLDEPSAPADVPSVPAERIADEPSVPASDADAPQKTDAAQDADTTAPADTSARDDAPVSDDGDAATTSRSPETASEKPEPASEKKENAAKPPRRGRGKPAVPAWEDVLLGVRSSGDN